MTTLLRRTTLLVILSFVIRHSAPGAIVYSGLQDIAIPTNFDGIYLDVDTATTSVSPITGWDINPFFGGYGIANSAAFQPVRIGTANMDRVLNLAYGTLINSASTYAVGEAGSDSHMGAAADQFQPGSDGYLGFVWTTNGGSGPFFGWMRVSLTYNAAGAVIRDWAYDDSGAPIFAGALSVVPEPSRALLVVLGVASQFLRRRRRQAAVSPAP